MPQQDGATKADHLFAIVRLFQGEPERRRTTREIAGLLNVSDDTARGYLNELAARGDLPLIQDGQTNRAVWYLEPNSVQRLPPLSLNFPQGAALYAAARLLSQQHDERIDAVRGAMLAIVAILPETLRPQLESVVQRLDQDAAGGADRSEIFDVLSQGWLRRRIVRLTYDPPGKRTFTADFAPYLLEPSGIGYTIYFLGHSTPPDALRTFKLERIRHAELTGRDFTIPADFDGLAKLRTAWGVMYGDDAPVRVRLRFDQAVSRRVRETRWHPSERLTETADGLLWEAEIGDVIEIRPWIRGWGADCEVLEPAGLRAELEHEVRRLMRRYRIAAPAPPADGPDPSLLDDLFGIAGG